jgi:hypothetical protein
MTSFITPNATPVPPILVASVLDRLAAFPANHRLDPAHLISIARGIGCSDVQTGALVVRIRAAAIELEDPRWRPWSGYFRMCPPDARCHFDALVLRTIAELPLTSSLRFPPGTFFDALLAGVTPDGCI